MLAIPGTSSASESKIEILLFSSPNFHLWTKELYWFKFWPKFGANLFQNRWHEPKPGCFSNFLFIKYSFLFQLCVKKRKLERKQKKLRYHSTYAVTNGGNSEVVYQRPNSNGQLPSAPPNYGKVVNLPDFNTSQSGVPNPPPVQTNPIAMSFSMNDAVFPVEEPTAPNKYVVSLASSPSINNQFVGRGEQDQAYISNSRTNGLNNRQKTYNNYV